MALNVDILSVNSLFINGVNILENKVDFVQLVGDEKIIIDVPSTTYTKVVPQIGVNLGDVELKTTPLDGKTFDTINNAGGVSVDGVSYDVDSVGAYVQDVNIDSFTIGQSGALKSIDFTTYKWSQVDYGLYSLILNSTGNDELAYNNVNFYNLSTILPTDPNILNISNDENYIITNQTLLNNDSKISSDVLFNNYKTIKFNNSKLELNNISSYFPSGYEDFTVEGVFYFIDNTQSYIFSMGTISSGLRLKLQQSSISVEWHSNGGVSTNPYAYDLNKWVHLVLQRKSNTLYYYINGKLIWSFDISFNINVNGNLYIGSLFGTSNFKNMYVASFSIYKYAKYNGDFAVDLTKKSMYPSNDFFITDNMYEFKGKNYLQVNPNDKYKFENGDFTIELDTKITYLDGTSMSSILENRIDNTSSSNYWSLSMDYTGKIVFATNNEQLISETTYYNEKINIVITRKDGLISMFINGKLDCSKYLPNNFTRDTFNIGRNAYTNNLVPYLTGFVGNLRITKGLCRYTANFTPSSTPDSGLKPVKSKVHTGTIIASDIEYDDYSVNYGTVLDPWVAVQPSITVSGEPFTLIDSVITSSNTFTSTETLNVGDIISSDKETFGTIIFKELDEYMVDSDIFFDGVTDKVFTTTDVNIINFVQDKRSNLYTNGLRDALLSAVSSTIYGHINDEIIVDAGEGGSFVLGTMYTSGGYNDTDTTSKFSISTSNDGVDYTVVYENQENLMTNHSHSMTGTGRFIKITFLNEIGDWGRIITNIVGGKWWDLHIVHPMSKVYKYSVVLEVNGKSIVPDYIQWFDNMTINKIVCGKVFINPTTVLNINTENISKVELDLWQEVKGVL